MDDPYIKITSAAYKLLDYFPESDPIKHKAKEKALAILDCATLLFLSSGQRTSLKTYLLPEKGQLLAKMAADIKILENYLAISKHQGWIDEINFLIIKKGYQDIEEKIAGINSAAIKTPKVLVSVATDQLGGNGQMNRNDPHFLIGKDISERQKKILAMMASRQKTQVADIVKDLPSITKRTIRRDLDDLLKKKKIMRFGEWNQVFYRILKGQA